MKSPESGSDPIFRSANRLSCALDFGQFQERPPRRRHYCPLDRCSCAGSPLAYLVYLAVPIVLLLVGSFGELWLNTLLPTGFTTQWYADVAKDPSFRRAFSASLAVVADHLHRVCGDRLAARVCAVPYAEPARARAGSRALSIAGRAAAAGARLRLHPRVLVGHAAVAGQHLAARGRTHRARPAVLSAGGRRRHAAPGPARARGRRGVAGQQRLCSASCTSCCRRCAIRSSPA